MRIKECKGSVEFSEDMIGRIELEIEFQKGDHVSRSVNAETEASKRRALQLAREVFAVTPGDPDHGPSIFMWDDS